MPARKTSTKKPVKVNKKPVVDNTTTTSTTVDVSPTLNLSNELTEIHKELDEMIKDLKKLVATIKSHNGNGKSGKGSRKIKDPNHPKRSRSAYIIFCNENRSNVQTDNPDLGAKDITRKLASMWKALPEKKRVPYNKKAAADKVRYENEMKVYQAS
jgi:hypothetical protein